MSCRELSERDAYRIANTSRSHPSLLEPDMWDLLFYLLSTSRHTHSAVIDDSILLYNTLSINSFNHFVFLCILSTHQLSFSILHVFHFFFKCPKLILFITKPFSVVPSSGFGGYSTNSYVEIQLERCSLDGGNSRVFACFGKT